MVCIDMDTALKNGYRSALENFLRAKDEQFTETV
jgi:hypothetical protein